MSIRELIVLGTASQVPTRHRNHNGYLLRWDGEGLLFDPGEGTQRQLLLAGVSASAVTRLCLTHFHGDHCLGVPGMLQRMSLDGASHPLRAYYPASGQEYFTRLRHASIFHDRLDVQAHPISDDGPVADGPFGHLEVRELDHPVPSVGYRLVEPDGRRMVPELLARFGIAGPLVGELQKAGEVRVGDRQVHLSDASEPRRGQRFAFIMDTQLCDAAFALAEDADLLVIEATFLHHDAELASRYGHLTARQAGTIAAESNVRRLVLTHFSQRYDDARRHHDEAAEVFGGEVITAEDLSRIPVPKRV